MECPLCAGEVARDQRYCFSCGGPCGPAAVDWRAVLGRPPAAVPYAHVEAPLEPVALELWTWPSPRAAAVLVLGMLAFGVAVGGVGGAVNAAAGSPRYVIVQQAQPQVAAGAVAEPELPEESLPSDDELASAPVDAGGDASTGSTASGSPTSTTTTPVEPEDKQPGDTTLALPPVTNVWLLVLGGADPQSDYLSKTLGKTTVPLSGYTPLASPSQLGAALIGGRSDELPLHAVSDHTLADRLTERGRTWRAYIDPPQQPADPANRCAEPVASSPLNPFLRFPVITAAPDCATSIQALSQLGGDLATADATPTLSYIGLAPAADGTLPSPEPTIAEITASAAFKAGGLLIVLEPADSSGGGRAWLKTPYTASGTSSTDGVSEFTVTRTIEELFGLEPLNTPATKRSEPLSPGILGSWPGAEPAAN